MIFGVDISEYQAEVDYERAVREGGVEFAILRAGYGRETNQKDEGFERHYAGFSAAGIPMGAYQYAYAVDEDGVRREAKAMQTWLSGKKFTFPVYWDVEEAPLRALGREKLTKLALLWCGEMEKAGWRPGIYASASWWDSVLDTAQIGSKYAVWCADWGRTQPKVKGMGMWQFGGSVNLLRPLTVAGFQGTVDQDYFIETETVETPAGGNGGTASVSVPTLREGAEGESVKSLQLLLIGKGYPCGSAGADGIFGQGTADAVRLFQRAKSLDADAVAGVRTWDAAING